MVQGGEQWPRGKQQTLLDLGTTQIPESARRKEGSLLSQARSVLALTSAPVTMPCREAEREDIASFVKDVVQAGMPLHLSGQFQPVSTRGCLIFRKLASLSNMAEEVYYGDRSFTSQICQ